MKVIKNRNKSKKREQLFFHDVINQTHGLLLFLNQCKKQKKDIQEDEIEMLANEVRILQSLIKNHFNFKHKNLSETHEWVSLGVAELSLLGLIKTYFPENAVKSFIHLKGASFSKNQLEEGAKFPIYFPVFYRIMNNLIKNMAEAHSMEVHFCFDYSAEGFVIETKNDFKKISDNIPHLHSEGECGLKSIDYLVREHGGSFNFEIIDGWWINRIYLPASCLQPDLNQAA